MVVGDNDDARTLVVSDLPEPGAPYVSSVGQPRLYVAIPFACSAEAVVPEQRKVICNEIQNTTDIWSVEALPASR